MFGSALHVTPPRSPLLGLSSQTIVFTNGPSLTLKTTLAGDLGCCLSVPVRATYQFGTVLTNGELDDQKRLGRYGPLFVKGREILAAGRSVILDGNFGDYARRKRLWELAGEFGSQVIAIRTACDDLDLIRLRAQRRAADLTSADHGVGLAAHLLTREEVLANPIEGDPEFGELGVEIVEFQTGRESFIAVPPDAGTDARMIASILAESGLLAPPSVWFMGGRGCSCEARA